MDNNTNMKLEGRDIYLYDDFNKETSLNLTKWLKDLENFEDRDPINLYINSDGGSTTDFFAVYDIIQNLKCDVNTISLGRSYSAGAMLLLSGTGDRKAYKHSSIMLHQLHSGMYYDRISEINKRSDFYNEHNDRVIEIVSKHTGQDKEKVEKDIIDDKYMHTEEALEYGIIDEIIGG